MRILHQIVLGLALARVAGHPAALAQPGEPGLAAGEQLVHVGLVARVEHDAVARRVEDPVQRDRELHHAEVRAEMAAAARYRLDQEVADLSGQLRELLLVQALHVLRATDGLKQGHSRLLLWSGCLGGCRTQAKRRRV